MLRSVLTLHALADFEVRVAGRLADSWKDFIDASSISFVDDAAEGPISTVILRGVDQSALIGLINALFSSGMPLLGVRRICDVA